MTRRHTISPVTALTVVGDGRDFGGLPRGLVRVAPLFLFRQPSYHCLRDSGKMSGLVADLGRTRIAMDPMPATREEHQAYLRILANVTPGERMKRAMDLSDMGLRMLKVNLRRRIPELDEERLHRLFLERSEQCHNREY